MRIKFFFFILIFTISGFSGLIYESIWSHYLKLFLGHAAYAQSLVLTIFMGGMALGSWLTSRYSANWKNLLLGYAVVEGVVGVLALFFHHGFVQLTEVLHNSIIPGIGSTDLVHTVKWTLAALLILPQSVLIGMTFPLMAAGILRRFPANPGRSLALLYFCNSFGAAIGVLASGFWLIKAVGLPGTIMTAGIINIALALTVWLIAREREIAAEKNVSAAPAAASLQAGRYSLLLLVALITGLASFVYEIAWIRMLSMVLGSSTHAFELMLSAFILGLALGGFWIRGRIDNIQNPPGFLAIVQILMGICALLSLLLYSSSFEAMAWLLQAVNKTEAGYGLFIAASHGLALFVMLPATFFAGMTLPLITYTLLRTKHGEKSIGLVYASNTLGAILGVLFAVHLGLPALGLKSTMLLAASLDILLGICILSFVCTNYSRPRLAAATALGFAAIFVTSTWVHLDPHKMASAVYRSGQASLDKSNRILYQSDGKTATITLRANPQNDVIIATNGKPDASIAMAADSRPTVDEPTMILAAALPLAFNPAARSAANIGMGSGLTTSTLLASGTLTQVDTIEIEAAMVEGAQGFRPRVERAYTDARSRIFIEDAKTFFSSQQQTYDIIVSEPSNPWVSGVASLFTDEFYSVIRNYLNRGGIFVQWLQGYETNMDILASVFQALGNNFPDYAVYNNHNDIIIIATAERELPQPQAFIFDHPLLRNELERIGIHTMKDLKSHRIAGKSILNPLFASAFTAPVNSDYFPYVDLNAGKARFFGAREVAFFSLTTAPLPLFPILGEQPVFSVTDSIPGNFYSSHAGNFAFKLHRYLIGDIAEDRLATNLNADLRLKAILIKELNTSCVKEAQTGQWIDYLFSYTTATATHIMPADASLLWQHLRTSRCFAYLSPYDRQWFAFLEAVSLHRNETIAALATALLQHKNPPLTGERQGYLIAAAMLAYLGLGDTEAALAVWTEFKPADWSPDRVNIYFRLLLSLAHAGAE